MFIKCKFEIDRGEYVPSRGWGHVIRYIEFAEDFIPVRHVDHYENGNVLRYHSTHYLDEFDMLADARFDGKSMTSWWGTEYEFCSEAEFECAWTVPGNPEITERQLSTRQTMMGREKCPYRELYARNG